jgi:hypothetical protein
MRHTTRMCYATTTKQRTIRTTVAMQSLEELSMQLLRNRKPVFSAWYVLISDKRDYLFDRNLFCEEMAFLNGIQLE